MKRERSSEELSEQGCAPSWPPTAAGGSGAPHAWMKVGGKGENRFQHTTKTNDRLNEKTRDNWAAKKLHGQTNEYIEQLNGKQNKRIIAPRRPYTSVQNDKT